MFISSDDIWSLLETVSENGYKPFLLLVPDTSLDKPFCTPIMTTFNEDHMKVMSEMVSLYHQGFDPYVNVNVWSGPTPEVLRETSYRRERWAIVFH